MNDISEKTVLFVDDEEAILSALKGLVEDEVGKVFTAELPSLALKIVKTQRIDLAVLDLKMPEMNGLELLKEIKKISPQTRFILVSGYGDREDMRTALRLGVDNFIDKPFEPNYVRLAVRGSLEKVAYESLVRQMLQLFVLPYWNVDISSFEKMDFAEKEKNLQAALAVAKIKILKSQDLK